MFYHNFHVNVHLQVGQYVSGEWLFVISCATKPNPQRVIIYRDSNYCHRKGNADEGVSGCGSYKKVKHLQKQSICFTDDWLVAGFDCRKTLYFAVRLVLHSQPFKRPKKGHLKGRL